MPKVAIVTTTYKHEKFIRETLDSIISQSFTDWELLIGDDSPDNMTWDIIEEYRRRFSGKIRSWHHTSNKGIIGNMNFLLGEIDSTVEYVAFLEGDDIFMPEYLEQKMLLWAKYPDLGLIYNELSCIDETGNILEKRFIAPRTRKWYKNESDTIGKLLTSDMTCFSYSTLMIRRYDGLAIRSFGKPDLMGSESDLWLQIASRHPIYGIEEPLTLYRRHAHNSSRDLTTTIGHFEYLVEKYRELSYISSSDHDKMRVMICMMRSFASLRSYEYIQAYIRCKESFQISFSSTIGMGISSLYYRIIKPYIYKIFYP